MSAWGEMLMAKNRVQKPLETVPVKIHVKYYSLVCSYIYDFLFDSDLYVNYLSIHTGAYLSPLVILKILSHEIC
jgi:hypothetical protein